MAENKLSEIKRYIHRRGFPRTTVEAAEQMAITNCNSLDGKEEEEMR